jgi:hypothetical protein
MDHAILAHLVVSGLASRHRCDLLAAGIIFRMDGSSRVVATDGDTDQRGVLGAVEQALPT